MIEQRANTIAKQEAQNWLNLVREYPDAVSDLSEFLLTALGDESLPGRWEVLGWLCRLAAASTPAERARAASQLALVTYELIVAAELPHARELAELEQRSTSQWASECKTQSGLPQTG